MGKSTKIILNLEDLVGNKRFRIPARFASDRDPTTLKSCIRIQIGENKWFIPVEESVEIAYEPFCVLKDAGILGRNRNFEDGEDFNPLEGKL